LKNYPTSSNRQEVQTALGEWTRECDEVAKGSVKWNNQWYHGEEAKSVASAMEVKQCIEEGDRQLQQGKYEAAIEYYKKALAPKPLQAQTVSTAESRIKDAIARWISLPWNPEPVLRAKRHDMESLHVKLRTYDDKIGVIRREAAFMQTAELDRLQHWISRDGRGYRVRDYGKVRPDANRYIAQSNLAELETEFRAIQAEISKINDFISNFTASSLSNQIHSIEADCVVAINNAKGELSSQQSSVAAPAPVTTSTVVAVTQTNQATVAAAPAQPVVSTTTQQPALQAPAPQEPPPEEPEPKQPFWQKYWYLILLGIVAAVIIAWRL
jgi:tetratricopeptide (TPR) repeat protein